MNLKNLLIAETGYLRLKDEIDQHQDKLRVYTLQANGKIQVDG